MENRLIQSFEQLNIDTTKPLGLIFDIDELLYNNSAEISLAYRTLLDDRAISALPGENFAGSDLFDIVRRLKQKYHLKESLDELVEERRRRYIELLSSSKGECLPGVKELFCFIHANRDNLDIRVAYASSSEKAFVDIILRNVFLACGLPQFAENPETFFYGGLDHPASMCWQKGLEKKPSPMLYNHTIQKLGLPVSQCLAFEDSKSGFQAARKAGLNVVVIPSAANQKAFEHLDDNVFNSDGVCKLTCISDFISILEVIKGQKISTVYP